MFFSNICLKYFDHHVFGMYELIILKALKNVVVCELGFLSDLTEGNTVLITKFITVLLAVL